MDGDTYTEKIFYSNKDKIVHSCCNYNDSNKLEVYKIPTGYRVFCKNCCATTDADDIKTAMELFYKQQFFIQPKCH